MSGTYVVLIAILVIVALLLYAYTGRAGGKAPPIRAERRHDWEKLLTAEHEDVLLDGLAAWRDAGHDLTVWHEGGKVDVYDPPMVISLYALADRFLREGMAASSDPKAELARLLDGWAEREEEGAVLHLRRDWADKAVVGDPARFTTVAADVLQNARAEVDGIEAATSDELRGEIDLSVRAGGAPDTVAIDLARVAAELQRRKDEDDRTPLVEMLRDVFHRLVSCGGGGVLWMRAPSPAERELALRVIEKSSVR